MQDSAAPVDGRAARAARTRDAIVEATVALVEAGDVRPTAPRIAGRAGVSVRSVFQHFDDLSALYTAVVCLVVERLAVLVVPPLAALGALSGALAVYRDPSSFLGRLGLWLNLVIFALGTLVVGAAWLYRRLG